MLAENREVEEAISSDLERFWSVTSKQECGSSSPRPNRDSGWWMGEKRFPLFCEAPERQSGNEL